MVVYVLFLVWGNRQDVIGLKKLLNEKGLNILIIIDKMIAKIWNKSTDLLSC